MNNEQAFQLTREYMGNLNIGGTFAAVGRHGQMDEPENRVQ